MPWWEQAQANLATAKVNAGAGIPYAASWFAQQAAERAIKALPEAIDLLPMPENRAQ